ncbi:hypothetical protein EV127DRAFT_476725 [Xylaria flabelliformis]|nr:hypothetical protein EV127DRAFT_476725 [Xylaria flabelliformis]
MDSDEHDDNDIADEDFIVAATQVTTPTHAATKESSEWKEKNAASEDKYNSVAKELEASRKETSDLTTELEAAKKGSSELEENLKTLQGAQITHVIGESAPKFKAACSSRKL